MKNMKMIKATIKMVGDERENKKTESIKGGNKKEVYNYNEERLSPTSIADASKYTLDTIGHMPNYVLRKYFAVPEKEIKRWRDESGVAVIGIEEIKVLRDIRLTSAAVAESIGYTAEQVEATRILYESRYTNLEDKLKYYYVEVKDRDNKLVVGGYLGKSFSWDDRNIIIKNIEKGIWQVALI